MEVERWMRGSRIDIACLQETKVRTTTKETRQGFTWFFCGSPETAHPPAAVFSSGVAIVLRSELVRFVEDAEP
eukprot:6393070-Prorocentrum_lima.AAC.1